MAELQIIDPGSFCTVQDLGRFGMGGIGVPVSGCCFPKSMKLANALVRNDLGTAGLEFFLNGPRLKAMGGAVRLCVFGECEIILGSGDQIAPKRSFILPEGETVSIRPPIGHKGGFIAIEGGVDMPSILGSRSTYIRSNLGSLLKAGDILSVQEADMAKPDLICDFEIKPPTKIRIVLGPQDDYFEQSEINKFLNSSYKITPDTDRMGARLEGPALIHRPEKGSQITSDATVKGAIQVPANGLPIVLLNDAQTVGGYPKIATVISSDLESLSQSLPGTPILFEAVSQAEAVLIARSENEVLLKIIAGFKPVFNKDNLDPSLLYENNLISGVVYETKDQGS